MAVAANLGFIIGPAIAGLLGGSAWGEMLPVLAAVSISAVATALIAFRLPESKLCILRKNPEHTNVRKVFGQEQKECFEIEDAEKLSMRETFRIRSVPLLLTIYFLVMLGFNFFYVSFPAYVAGVLAWDVTDTGIFFAVLSLLMVLVQGPVLGRVSRKVSDRLLVMVGSLILSGSFVYFIAGGKALIYTGAALLALGNGLMWPSMMSILSKVAGETHQGAVQGLAGSVGATASVIGLVVGGVLYGIFSEWIFVMSAIIILTAFVMSWKLLRSSSVGAVSH